MATDYCKLLECPTCKQLMQGTIFRCANGDVICKRCRDKLTQEICPMCHIPLDQHIQDKLLMQTHNVAIGLLPCPKCKFNIWQERYSAHVNPCCRGGVANDLDAQEWFIYYLEIVRTKNVTVDPITLTPTKGKFYVYSFLPLRCLCECGAPQVNVQLVPSCVDARNPTAVIVCTGRCCARRCQLDLGVWLPHIATLRVQRMSSHELSNLMDIVAKETSAQENSTLLIAEIADKLHTNILLRRTYANNYGLKDDSVLSILKRGLEDKTGQILSKLATELGVAM